jgi:hypothetical protein
MGVLNIAVTRSEKDGFGGELALAAEIRQISAAEPVLVGGGREQSTGLQLRSP